MFVAIPAHQGRRRSEADEFVVKMFGYYDFFLIMSIYNTCNTCNSDNDKNQCCLLKKNEEGEEAEEKAISNSNKKR